MIKNKTVLVLGAGASIPYGFPTGKQLLEQIVDIKHHSPTRLEESLRECGFSNDLIKDLATELELSGRNSVDAFLEHRTEYEKVGKAAIVAALIPKEEPARIVDRSNEEHWYQYLFDQMGSSLDDVWKSKLSVITFNYDRSLEYFLLNAIKSSFKQDEADCHSVLNSRPILHVHGQLGLLNKNSGGRYRPFEGKVTSDIIERCIPEIKIVHENVSETPEFITARSMINGAERVCFLGFGYNRSNVQRLLGHDVQGLTYSMKQWFGTAKGFTGAEVNEIKTRMPQGFSGYSKYNNLEFLRETGVLF